MTHQSSFSAKIELAFAFHLINENLYKSLNALRKIRNEAAHSSYTFSLIEIKNEIKEIYMIGPNIPDYIHIKAMEMMAHMKFDSLQRMFDELGLSDEQKIDKLRIFSKINRVSAPKFK